MASRSKVNVTADEAWRQLLEERQHQRSSQSLADHDLTGRADTVKLKNSLWPNRGLSC
jgi:hypothetical protein